MKISNIKTDNIPLLDEVIYYLKMLSLSCILKDEQKALNYETLDITKKADIYIACIEGRSALFMFDFTREWLKENTTYPDSIIEQAYNDPQLLSTNIQKDLLINITKYYINNYEELNNYYRMLNGKPNIGDPGIKLTKDIVSNDDIVGLNYSLYVHEIDKYILDILYDKGIIDKLLQLYPDKEYLNYLGSKSIDIYNARIADDFSLLYVDNSVPEIISNKFKEKIELNKVYTLKTIYSTAYKYGSDYYDNFIRILIIIQSIVDILSELPNMIIKREFFDIRMVQLIFESNGIDFFPEIPMRYQMNMIMNLNILIQFKSTTRNIVDICSLFGFDNIEVFKYYLLKYRKLDENNNFIYSTKEILDPDDPSKNITVPDPRSDYELKFIKVPINDNIDEYLHDKTKQVDYDTIVEGDPYWIGDSTYEDVKNQILDREFNYLQSKYLEVDTIYNMTEMAFQVTYFFNMIFDNVDVEEQLTIQLANITGKSTIFKFVDIICYLFALSYLSNNLEDSIMDSTSKIMSIKGFNFDADIEALSNYVQQKGFTLEDLGVSDFQIPITSIPTQQQMINIFTKNMNIYNHVISQIKNADNKKIYDIYKKVYDSLMIDQLSFDFFKNPDGTVAKTFTEFLQHRNSILYTSIQDIKNITSEQERQQKITSIIGDIIYVLDEEFDLSQFKFLFAHFPAASAEAIKGYINKIVNFFKSYKVQIFSINTIYLFDNKLDNCIKMIDEAIINHVLNKVETIEPLIKSRVTSNLPKRDKLDLMDKMYTEITYWIDKYLYTDIKTKDEIKSNLSKYIFKDKPEIIDIINYTAKLLNISDTNIHDNHKIHISIEETEKIKLLERLYFSITYWINKYFSSNIKIYDYIDFIIGSYKSTNININDNLSIIANKYFDDEIQISDSIQINAIFE